MGTLGYLAPEVIATGWRPSDTAYDAKCDLWSLGIVFYEMLTGQPAFHKERGFCDGYTEEVVLREIQEVTQDKIDALLADIPRGAVEFMRRVLHRDPSARPSAHEMFEDPYLADARHKLLNPPGALEVDAVLERLRANGASSKPCRAWLLATARSPTQLPWNQYLGLRNTFIMLSAHGNDGTISLNTFLSVAAAHGTQVPEDEIMRIWSRICGEQESLGYIEFMAALLPPIEDAFMDVDDQFPSAFNRQLTPESPVGESQVDCTDIRDRLGSALEVAGSTQWNPSQPISAYLHLLQERRKIPVFTEDMSVLEVVRAMSEKHLRWVIIKYLNGNQSFFDYMDINHFVVTSKEKPSVVMAKVASMPVGEVANCSGHAAFVPVDLNTPLRKILQLVSGAGNDAQVRRAPIIAPSGEVVYVFSCLDFLSLALKFPGPEACLKSQAARTFDCRETIMRSSVLHDAALVNSLRIMDSQGLTICPATSVELSGTMGGVVASNVVSVADLKWVITEGEFGIMDGSVSNFIDWRSKIAHERASLSTALRKQHLNRRITKFNVVSVHAADSLHSLASRLLASKLQRIFLSSEDIGRIVGIVSSRDLLAEVLDQIV